MVLLNMAWMKNSNYIIKIGILPEMLANSSVTGFIIKLYKSAAYEVCYDFIRNLPSFLG